MILINFPFSEEEISFIVENIDNMSREYRLFLLVRTGDSREYVQMILGKALASIDMGGPPR